MSLKWGIAGAGRISHDFVAALTVFPSSQHQVVAVAAAAGSKTRADNFSVDHQIPRSYEGYEGLAKDEDVETIHISTSDSIEFDIIDVPASENDSLQIVELQEDADIRGQPGPSTDLKEKDDKENWAKYTPTLLKAPKATPLCNSPKKDIVYVGNLNTQHFDTTKLMLEHGKHVLCEKPFTLNQRQTHKLVQIARQKKLFLMEAVWSRCFPAYKEIKRLIDEGAIGEVLFASVHFGHALQHVERLTALRMGGGAILDLGVYILQFQQYVFRNLKPLKIVVNGHLNQSGTDESCGVIFTYPNGKMAVVSTSARVSLPNEGIVVGTKGTLRLPDFWCPNKLITDDQVLEFPFPETTETFLHKNSVGLCYEAEEARQCIREGKLESPCITLEESIELARLMDYLREEMGVAYPEDFQDI